MFTEAGTQVSLVKMSCPSLRTAAPPCLPQDVKDSMKEDVRFFGFGAFGFWMKGGFLMWEALEGKTIA
jgi:hypothetical protein